MIEKESKIVGSVVLNDYRRVTVSIALYNSVLRLDIREQIDTVQNLNEPNWVFTRRGLSIPMDEYEKFKKLIIKVKKYSDIDIKEDEIEI